MLRSPLNSSLRATSSSTAHISRVDAMSTDLSRENVSSVFCRLVDSFRAGTSWRAAHPQMLRLLARAQFGSARGVGTRAAGVLTTLVRGISPRSGAPGCQGAPISGIYERRTPPPGCPPGSCAAHHSQETSRRRDSQKRPARQPIRDVCPSTGVGATRAYYLTRPAIAGADDRGGAMALLAALEIHELRATARSARAR